MASASLEISLLSIFTKSDKIFLGVIYPKRFNKIQQMIIENNWKTLNIKSPILCTFLGFPNQETKRIMISHKFPDPSKDRQKNRSAIILNLFKNCPKLRVRFPDLDNYVQNLWYPWKCQFSSPSLRHNNVMYNVQCKSTRFLRTIMNLLFSLHYSIQYEANIPSWW